MRKAKKWKHIFIAVYICIVISSVLYYALNYHALEDFQRINLEEDRYTLLISSFSLILVIFSLVVNWRKKEYVEELLFVFNRPWTKWAYFFSILTLIALIINIRILIVRPGYIPLSGVILTSTIFTGVFLPELFKCNGIGKDGIIYERVHILWKDLESYTWQGDKKLYIIFNGVSKKLWTSLNKLKFKVEKKSREDIERLIWGKLKEAD